VSVYIEQINPFSLPSVRLEDKNKLPKDAGIYFVIANAEILYIGKSINLQQRWLSHHRTNQLQSYGEVIIAWFTFMGQENKDLDELEEKCIEYFNPSLNNIDVPKEFAGSKSSNCLSLQWRLRTIMADRNISTQDLAEKMGMSRVQLSRLRNTPNDTFPRVSGDVLDKLCKFLKCGIPDLIAYYPNGRPNSIEYIPDDKKAEQDSGLALP
jgi:DNA-binding Xre family transcriptional regulator